VSDTLLTLNSSDSVNLILQLEIIKEIGAEEGRNSKVWLAKDIQLNEILILKGVLKSTFKEHEVDHYYLESQIINDCKHPHIVPITYAGMDENYIYMTLPYFKNGSLKSLCDTKFLTVKEIISYSLDFLNGLLFLHIKTVIHLDIKPTNILIDDRGKAILTDFGLSKYLNEYGIARQNKFYVQHVTPDMYKSHDRRILDDIYNVGLTLYRLANGENEFKKQFSDLLASINKTEFDFTAMDIRDFILNGEFPNRSKYLPHIPIKLQKVINKALSVEENTRYQNVLELLNDLSKIDDFINWVFTMESNNYTWKYHNDKMEYIVTLNVQQGQIVSNGLKINRSNNRTQNINKFNNQYDNLETAFKELAKLLKNDPGKA